MNARKTELGKHPVCKGHWGVHCAISKLIHGRLRHDCLQESAVPESCQYSQNEKVMNDLYTGIGGACVSKGFSHGTLSSLVSNTLAWPDQPP